MTKWFDRQPMSDIEKRMFLANKQLVEEKTLMEKDIRKLIAYIKGNKYIERDVQEIITYWTNKLRRTKYDE